MESFSLSDIVYIHEVFFTISHIVGHPGGMTKFAAQSLKGLHVLDCCILRPHSDTEQS